MKKVCFFSITYSTIITSLILLFSYRAFPLISYAFWQILGIKSKDFLFEFWFSIFLVFVIWLFWFRIIYFLAEASYKNNQNHDGN